MEVVDAEYQWCARKQFVGCLMDLPLSPGIVENLHSISLRRKELISGNLYENYSGGSQPLDVCTLDVHDLCIAAYTKQESGWHLWAVAVTMTSSRGGELSPSHRTSLIQSKLKLTAIATKTMTTMMMISACALDMYSPTCLLALSLLCYYCYSVSSISLPLARSFDLSVFHCCYRCPLRVYVCTLVW